MSPVKNPRDDFLRRHYPHQVKGSKVIPSSQPVSTSSPVFFYYLRLNVSLLQNFSLESILLPE